MKGLLLGFMISGAVATSANAASPSCDISKNAATNSFAAMVLKNWLATQQNNSIAFVEGVLDYCKLYPSSNLEEAAKNVLSQIQQSEAQDSKMRATHHNECLAEKRVIEHDYSEEAAQTEEKNNSDFLGEVVPWHKLEGDQKGTPGWFRDYCPFSDRPKIVGKYS